MNMLLYIQRSGLGVLVHPMPDVELSPRTSLMIIHDSEAEDVPGTSVVHLSTLAALRTQVPVTRSESSQSDRVSGKLPSPRREPGLGSGNTRRNDCDPEFWQFIASWCKSRPRPSAWVLLEY